MTAEIHQNKDSFELNYEALSSQSSRSLGLEEVWGCIATLSEASLEGHIFSLEEDPELEEEEQPDQESPCKGEEEGLTLNPSMDMEDQENPEHPQETAYTAVPTKRKPLFLLHFFR